MQIRDKNRSAIVSVSALYNNFEGGVLFYDIHEGLDILWQAGLKKNRPFKEHLAFAVWEGVLICPNAGNTLQSASLASLPLKIEGNKLFVLFEGKYREVLGIIHTHVTGSPTPSPRTDFQFGYLGIHNYVMSYLDLYDAYRDTRGREVTKRLGPRWAYDKLHFNGPLNQHVGKE